MCALRQIFDEFHPWIGEGEKLIQFSRRFRTNCRCFPSLCHTCAKNLKNTPTIIRTFRFLDWTISPMSAIKIQNGLEIKDQGEFGNHKNRIIQYNRSRNGGIINGNEGDLARTECRLHSGWNLKGTFSI